MSRCSIWRVSRRYFFVGMFSAVIRTRLVRKLCRFISKTLTMTLKQLHAFYWAATLGSFSIAAERLHISQSTLSKRIVELEAGLNVQLFDRSTKQAQLSEQGHRLLKHAAKVLDLTDLIRSESQAEGNLAGLCRIGITELGSLTWLPRFIVQARVLYPDLTFQPYVDLTANLESMVYRGELDCAVAPGVSNHEMLAINKICEVECAWMASPARVKKGAVLRPKEIAALPAIAMTTGSGMTASIDHWALLHGIRMNYTLASNSLMAITGLTVADIGVSYLPRLFVTPWLEDNRLVSFETEPRAPDLAYYFLQRSDDRRELVSRMKALLFSEACGIVGGRWMAPTKPLDMKKSDMTSAK